jgi:4-methylaminobutanoate oxidase (formaldehyde-forming)
MVADVTVTRLAQDAFRVVTGAGFVASDLAWLRWHRADADDVTVRDVSAEHATIGLWGPRARDVLGAATPDDVSDDALPMRRAGTVHVAGAAVLAARISYAGELGWELTVGAEAAVTVWDRLWAAGRDHDLEPFGYRALDGLRMEKGYRYYGTDMTMLETPFAAGLGAFVRLETGPFIGRDALRAAHDAAPDGADRRLATILIGANDGYLPVYGGEAVRAGGEVIGRVRSVSYGPTVARTVGYAYRPVALEEGMTLTVDVFDQRIEAAVAPDVLVDPRGERMRG